MYLIKFNVFLSALRYQIRYAYLKFYKHDKLLDFDATC